MNFVAGYLLIITKDEEKSFWLMDALLGRILPGVYVDLDMNLPSFWPYDRCECLSELQIIP